MKRSDMRPALKPLLTALLWPLLGLAWAADTTPAKELERYSAQAAQAPSAARGELFFKARHGGDWSCSTCHGVPPVEAGKHTVTGKSIAALAPQANPKAFTDSARVEKWFRRNCKDVLSRECTAIEKSDVLAYLIQLK